MQWIKTALLACALCLSFNASAMTDDEETVWREAISGGDLKTIKEYVKQDKEVVNHKIFGWSALQMAASANQLEVVKYLVKQGVDLNYMQPYAHHTAFHVAAFKQYKEMTELLANSGADINIKLNNGLSIIQFFRDEGQPKMAEYLLSLGVKDDGCNGEWC